MQRKFFRDTVLCLLPVLIAGFLTFRAYQKYERGEGGFILGIDLAGGYSLIYEVDTRVTEELKRQTQPSNLDPDADMGESSGTGLSTLEMTRLVEALKRRIDPNDLKNVQIKPLGRTRVEITLPTGGGSSGAKSNFTQEEVEGIKALLRQVGNLEFRIVANEDDDRAAVEAAEEFIKDPTNKARMDELALDGFPPAFPEGTYEDQLGKAEYAWVELGQEERLQLGLSNQFERNPGNLWSALAKAREEGRCYLHKQPREGGRLSMLLYSRKCVNQRLSEADRIKKKYEYFVLTRSSDSVRVSGGVSLHARVDQDSNLQTVVAFKFNGEGARQFQAITSKNRPSNPQEGGKLFRQLAIILDGYLKSAPSINQTISDSGIIQGNYQKKDADQLVSILNSGALNAALKPEPESTEEIPPTLGEATIKSGTYSIILAFVVVLVFMCIYYRFAGFVASVALFANLILTIGFMVSVSAAFTLPGLAGLVLMLGMAVDANVLIYERIREERDRGANLTVALRNGYDRAFPTIIDTHLSSIFTAIVLYAVGNAPLRGFGISLTVGLIISLFTSLFMTRLIFDYWMNKRWLTQLKMLRFFSRPNIDFMKIRYAMFSLTAVLTVIGLGIFLVRGNKGLSVEFLGGVEYSGELRSDKEIKLSELEKLLNEQRQKEVLRVASVEAREESTKYRNVYLIKYADQSEQLVSLSNPPEGKTDEEKIENLKVRADELSVAQLQLLDNKRFQIQTTEKELELVQISLDRLLQQDSKSLLVKGDFTFTKNDKGWELAFIDPVTQEPLPTSQNYVNMLLEREFQRSIKTTSFRSPFLLKGVGDEVSGRYSKMQFTLAEGSKVEPAAVEAVLKATKDSLTSRPIPERVKVTGSTLAKEMRDKATWAILLSWLAIMGYLWFRFGNWTFGLAAVICLIHDLCFTLGAIAVCGYIHDSVFGSALLLQDFKIDLAAVAALLTLVGYSVNDTIVVFDRIREVRGKNPVLTPQMINDSINQTLSRTLLTSLITWLVVLVLYLFGGEGVHLFSFVMVLGVIVGTYSSIYIASPLLLIFGEGNPQSSGTTPVTTGAPQGATV